MDDLTAWRAETIETIMLIASCNGIRCTNPRLGPSGGIETYVRGSANATLFRLLQIAGYDVITGDDTLSVNVSTPKRERQKLQK